MSGIFQKFPTTLFWFALALKIGILSPLLTAADNVPPNFVVIFIDDMGYGDIGPYGSTKNRTPNLDQMAAEGMKLTSFYAAPVCSASRAQLLTGSYAPRVSVPGVFFPAGGKGLHPDEHTIADYLSELGYATSCIGKWHLGDQVKFLPNRQGFDRYFGIPYSNDMSRPAKKDGRRVHPLMRNETVERLIEDEDQRQITRQYTTESIAFLEQQAAAGKPFFLYLPHTAMHVPIYPHPDFLGKSANGQYGDWVEEVDWSVGQILAALERLDLEDNTLVVFTSDNGPWASKGENGGDTGPLRGSKGSTWEGGVREPTIVRWPGKIPAGTANDGILGTTDLLPTFVGLAGGKLKTDRSIDGHDIAAILLGEASEIPDRAWHYYRGTHLEAVRRGPWKLDLVDKAPGMGFPKPGSMNKKLPGRENPFQPRLYHLGDDIGETRDLAAANPGLVAELQQLADTMSADIASHARPAGQVDNPVTLYPSIPRTNTASPAIVPARSMAPIEWMSVKLGDQYSQFSAPEIAGKAFTIEAAITPETGTANGVIVSHGGSQTGYSLHLKGGHAVFAIRISGNEIREVASPEKITAKTSLRAELNVDGVLSVKAGAREEARTGVGALISRHPQEDLCVGHDANNPVVDHGDAGTRFQGELHSLSVTVEAAP